MELIKVSAARLKVVLSAEDMGAYGITSDELGNALPQARQVFRRILDKAKNETGFETGDGRLYVRVFEGNDGGCELFVSKKVLMLPEPDGAPSYGRISRKEADGSARSYAYIASVSDFDDLASLCARLNEARFAGQSALYYYRDAYRLYLRFGRAFPTFEPDASEEEKCDTLNRFSFIGDYANIVCADALKLSVLREHGKCVAEKNAVSKVARTNGL